MPTFAVFFYYADIRIVRIILVRDFNVCHLLLQCVHNFSGTSDVILIKCITYKLFGRWRH